jgi:CheY-like chemotaxis protein
MSKIRILVIDDEPQFCKAVKLNLEHSGSYEVATAQSGEDGLCQATTRDFDLIITDLRMPGLDGQAVLRTLKDKRSHIPVVLLSIYHDDDQMIPPDVARLADGVVSKPIDHSELEQAIHQALAKHQPHHS